MKPHAAQPVQASKRNPSAQAVGMHAMPSQPCPGGHDGAARLGGGPKCDQLVMDGAGNGGRSGSSVGAVAGTALRASAEIVGASRIS
jgi:hypothetical protein